MSDVTRVDPPEFVAAPSMQSGVYANRLDVWYSPYEFTLDFGVEPRWEDIGLKYAVVARVRLPPSRLFQAIREMNGLLYAYERRWGAVAVPGDAEEPPLYPPDDLTGGADV